MRRVVTMCVPAAADLMGDFRAALMAWVGGRASSGRCRDLEQALGEALQNALRHGLHDADALIAATVAEDDDCVAVTVRNHGERFRPEEKRQPDPADMAQCGYGLTIIRAFTESEWSDGGRCVVMRVPRV